jgi:DNA-binding MarR family transcriptional regulator
MTREVEPIVSDALVFAARLHRFRASQRLSALGLFAGQDRLLLVLAQRGQLTVGDLADALQVRPPTVSKTVARLSALALVTRNSSDGDGRIVHVGLTDLGRNVAGQVAELDRALEAEFTEGFDQKDRKRLRKLLRRGAQNLSRQAGLGDDPNLASDVEDRDTPPVAD